MPPGALNNNFSGSQKGGCPAPGLPPARKDYCLVIHNIQHPARLQPYVRRTPHKLILQQRLHIQ